MLGWINKKLKMTLVKGELRQHGLNGFYPDPLLREIVDVTFEMTKSLSEASLSGPSFDFDGNWKFYLSPYIKLLYANAMMTSMRGSMTDEQLGEAITLSGGEGQFSDIHSTTDQHVEGLLERYGYESHLAAIRPIFNG